jgi:hypothetical protein
MPVKTGFLLTFKTLHLIFIAAHKRERERERERGDTRIARWFVFKPKIQIWVNFGGSCTGRYCYI